MYCPLSTDQSTDNYSEEEEVFLSENTAKYYNIGREPGRRHSIASYMTHERERALSLSSCSRSCQEEAIVHATADGQIVRAPSLGGTSRRSHRFGVKSKSLLI